MPRSVAPQLHEVAVPSLSLERFRPIVGDAQVDSALAIGHRLAHQLAGRAVWNVNSTRFGGGVAALLQQLVGYGRGLGIQVRWAVIAGRPEFFRVTKRLHNAVHGACGDGSSLGLRARAIYEGVLSENHAALLRRIKPRDIVILHDLQTAGLAPKLLRDRVEVIWRCHVGSNEQNVETRRGWRFLAPYLAEVPTYVFTRAAYAPASLDPRRVVVIQPSIDPFSPNNQELSQEQCVAILRAVGLLEGAPDPNQARFVRLNGRSAGIVHGADVFHLGRLPAPTAPLVLQVCRWDRLKDPVGLISGFGHMLSLRTDLQANLLVAGPNVSAIADDPEGGEVFDEAVTAWRQLPHQIRRRVVLAALPARDPDENAAIVNALQRHARVVVQKSLREGFGLTVTSAMWKGRPILASGVGGLRDQLEHEVSGLLLDDPTDESELAEKLARLLTDDELARRLGRNAQARARERFLVVRHLLEYGALLERLAG